MDKISFYSFLSSEINISVQKWSINVRVGSRLPISLFQREYYPSPFYIACFVRLGDFTAGTAVVPCFTSFHMRMWHIFIGRVPFFFFFFRVHSAHCASSSDDVVQALHTLIVFNEAPSQVHEPHSAHMWQWPSSSLGAQFTGGDFCLRWPSSNSADPNTPSGFPVHLWPC